MDNLYITSDLHFYHIRIIKYCNRPYEFSWDGVAQMNEDILKEFDKLPNGSTIINLGDVVLSSGITFEKYKEVVSRMKSNDKKLWLVLGNHDKELISRCKDFNRFSNLEELFTELGFDKVFLEPIEFNGYLLSHEPVYLKDGKNIHGHIHDCDMTNDYFCRECENFAMMERVKKENITPNKENFYIDTEKISNPELTVNTDNYFNVCWDKHHRILPFEEIEL